ncbi:hypothetical protein M0R45_002161 [Rubus argutus]|uniref:Uncharacterized protein n=1 Tax=Rubus argutus TaxID=59490 RepID=A0AAW1VHN8_RUBAR
MVRDHLNNKEELEEKHKVRKRKKFADCLYDQHLKMSAMKSTKLEEEVKEVEKDDEKKDDEEKKKEEGDEKDGTHELKKDENNDGDDGNGLMEGKNGESKKRNNQSDVGRQTEKKDMEKNDGNDRESTPDSPKGINSEFVDLTATTPKLYNDVDLSVDRPARGNKKKRDRTIDWNVSLAF